MWNRKSAGSESHYRRGTSRLGSYPPPAEVQEKKLRISFLNEAALALILVGERVALDLGWAECYEFSR
jgi:hypothetical protein